MSLSRWLSRTTQPLLRSTSSRRRFSPLSSPQEWVLEDRCLLSGDPVMPAPGGNQTLSVVFFMGNATVGNVPTKQITLYNNTGNTLFPFLYDANTGTDAVYSNHYDPYDQPSQEYRLYAGYTQGGVNYMGLQSHTSITMTVPFVFWDSGRIAVGTDGATLLPTFVDASGNLGATDTSAFQYTTNNIDNPFHFEFFNGNPTTRLPTTSTDRIQVATTTTNMDTNVTSNNGMLLYYHCSDSPALGPAADAPAQLGEFTIRDKDFLTAVSNNGNKLDPTQLVTLVNYDVSYVDQLLLPVAMEATAVPITAPKPGGGYTILGYQDYGWAGAQQTFQGDGSLQASVLAFAGLQPGTASGLGTYFNGAAWPTYYNPTTTTDPTNAPAGVEIPSGEDIFLNSPLNQSVSSYTTQYGPNNVWMLSSGGSAPIQFGLGGTFNIVTSGGNTTYEANLSPGPTLNVALPFLKKGVVVQGNGGTPLGTIAADATSGTVILTLAAGVTPPADGTPESYVFLTNPANDPYATQITDIWYSWAIYYQNQFAAFKTQFPNGETISNVVVTADTDATNDYRILTLPNDTGSTPLLAIGMQVSQQNGSALPNLVTIAKIVQDANTGQWQYYLSAPVNGTGTASFTFLAPQPLVSVDPKTGKTVTIQPATPKYAIDNTQFGNFQGGDPNSFAAQVYEVMSIFSTVLAKDQPGYLPLAMDDISNSIGGNVGFLPTANNGVNFTNISADARDLIKDILRGVSNYGTVPESLWYPDPSTPMTGTGPANGETFNLFNLDPYVWFVHREAGLSGYGFSFDDDSADVGANLAQNLSIAAGGLKGFNNTSEWSASTPWGQLTNKPAQIFDELYGPTGNQREVTIIQFVGPDAALYYNQVLANQPTNSIIGAYVSGPDLPTTGPGTPVNLAATADISLNQFILSVYIPNLPSSNPLTGFYTFSAKPLTNTFLGAPGGGESTPTLGQTLALNQYVAVGAGAGGAPQVVVYNAGTGAVVSSFYAFAPSFSGGVRVAVDDLNGDGTPDILAAAGPGGGPQVIVIDGTKLTQLQSNGEIASTAVIASFYAFASGFTGGVYIAAATSALGQNWIVAGAGAGGGPQVVVWTAAAILAAGGGSPPVPLVSFYAFAPGFTGGVTVAVGDILNTGQLDVICGAGPGGGPQVVIVDGSKVRNIPSNGFLPSSVVLASFEAFAPGFKGGVFVSGGAAPGGQFELVIGAGPGGGPQVLVIEADLLGQLQSNGEIASSALLSSFDEQKASFTGGVVVGFSTAYGSNGLPVILAGPASGGSPQVTPFDAATFQALSSFFALPQGFLDGLFIAG